MRGVCATTTSICALVSVRWHEQVDVTRVITDGTQGLPFQSDVNTGFGILAKTYLDAATFHFGDTITDENVDTDAVQQAKRSALEFVDQAFTGVKAPTQEVERGFRFWDAVSGGFISDHLRAKSQNERPRLYSVCLS